MHKNTIACMIAGFLAVTATTATARLYDTFTNDDENWILTDDSGTAVIETNVLLLTSPSGITSYPTATCDSEQSLTNSRQSILVRSHTGVTNSTVFFFWAIDSVTENKLELKLDDIGPTTVVAGYYDENGSNYNYVASAAYSPGADGLYLAFQETNGVTYWQISTDASNWTDVASAKDPVSPLSTVFEMQHKAYVATSAPTYTTVACFNYRLHGIGYYSIQTNTIYGAGDWQLYTEGFTNGVRFCASDDDLPSCGMNVGGVDSTWHFTDTSIPAPYTNQDGFDFRIINTEEATTKDYYNAYYYQYLPFVDADQWTYHLYFKYTYPQYITQGLEFPIDKYTGTNLLQGGLAWYPQNETTNGQWSVWTGSTWHPTGLYQIFKTNYWYEITFTVGLHDDQIFYDGFQAGTVGSLTSFNLTTNYYATGSDNPAGIVPAMQIDDNDKDTTTNNTQKDAYLAEWHITSMYQRLH